jgi:hypothetical protein
VGLFQRAVFAGDTDALDATRRPGHLVNLQSIVTVFDHDDHRVLFAGDMQIEDPGGGRPELLDAIAALRASIADAGPYDFAKVSHHGSPNAIGPKVLDDLGSTPLLGICAGENSEKHPERSVLELLAARGLEWGRTDRNGAVTVEFTDQGAALHVTRGRPSDPTPNAEDVLPAPREPAPPAAPPGSTISAVGRVDDHVEVVVRVPLGAEATVRIEAGGSTTAPAGLDLFDMADPVRIGGGRALPKLLWVTHPRALAENIGRAESVALLAGLRAAGHDVLLDMPPPASDPTSALRQVRDALANAPTTEGVVILGGYDVVPGTRLDTLSPELRDAIGDAGDPDRWVVWSDDAYGDTDGDSFPELPVSRIPDFKKAEAMRAAVEAAPPAAGERRSGIRNRERPFAQPIFDDIDGTLDMLHSAPEETPPPGVTGVEGRNVYLMLHGSWADGTRFWGEGDAGSVEALTNKHVDSVEPDVAFAGCCWGALITDVPAAHARPGQPLVSKPTDGSIAAAFLLAGARAFIGCTGAHYSPTQQPYGYFGGPLHREFWARLASGAAPAQALFDTKSTYAAAIPHSKPHAREIAVELKIFRQFTCLGLGW